MWSNKDIRSLMLLSGIIGTMIGTIGIATYVLVKSFKNSNSKEEA